MRSFFLQAVAQEPAVCHIQRNFFRSAAQRSQSIQMLNENHFEQHNRIYARATIISTVQRLYHIVDLAEIDSSIYFSQQMICRHQTFGVHNFKHASLHFSTF
jgi:hypothetical protein